MNTSAHIRDLADTDKIRKAISYGELAHDGASFVHARKTLWDTEQSLLQVAAKVERMEEAGQYLLDWLNGLVREYGAEVVLSAMPPKGMGQKELRAIFGGQSENEPREQPEHPHYSGVRIEP